MASERISDLPAGSPPYDPASLVEVSVPTGTSPPYASRAAELGDLAGLVKLVEGTISSPVSALDLSLPAGFRKYLLWLDNVYFTASDSYLVGALSTDGGSSFHNDATNFDTYLSITLTTSAASPYTSAAAQSQAGFDAVLDLGALVQGNAAGVDIASSLFVDIMPGTANDLAQIFVRGFSMSANGNISLNNSQIVLSPGATVSPGFTRSNLLRLADYGSGDIEALTGSTIASGSYTLIGVI